MRSATFLLALAVAGCGSSSSQDDKPASSHPASDPRDQLTATLDLEFLGVPWPKDGSGLRPGTWIEQTRVATAGVATETITHMTVVADAGDALKVEVFLAERSLQHVLGLTVRKSDGTILAAVAAKKGEKARAIKLPPPAVAPPPPPTPTVESVDTPAGSYSCSKTVFTGTFGDHTIWEGREGDARGVLVKDLDDNVGTPRVLKTLVAEQLAIKARKLSTVHATYDDGSESWYVHDPVVPFFFVAGTARVKEIREGGTTERAWGEGEQSTIDWGN